MARENREVNIPVSIEEAEELYQWLQGKESETIFSKAQPRLTPEEAFSTIYYLQEELGIIPDTYEQCSKCKALYDSDDEGTSINEYTEPYLSDELVDEEGNPKEVEWDESEYGYYCDGCRPI